MASQYTVYLSSWYKMENQKDLLIDIRNLTRWYKESTALLFDKFNFSLYKNEFCVIMWKSWVGKSTLVKLIIWSILPPAKTIYHKNEDISKYSDQELQKYRRKIWVVFQDCKLLESASVKENIQYPLKIYGLWDVVIGNKMKNVISKLWLEKVINKPVKFLSTWEKHKVAIARALIHEPEFLITDEPTGNLDREHTEQIWDLLIETNRIGNTVLLVTHDIHLVNYLKAKYKIRIYLMKYTAPLWKV